MSTLNIQSSVQNMFMTGMLNSYLNANNFIGVLNYYGKIEYTDVPYQIITPLTLEGDISAATDYNATGAPVSTAGLNHFTLPIKTLSRNVEFSQDLIDASQSSYRVIDSLNAALKPQFESHINSLEAQLLGDGTGAAGRDWDGLLSFITNTPTQYAGISDSVNRNIRVNITSEFGAALSKDNIVHILRQLRTLTKGKNIMCLMDTGSYRLLSQAPEAVITQNANIQSAPMMTPDGDNGYLKMSNGNRISLGAVSFDVGGTPVYVIPGYETPNQKAPAFPANTILFVDLDHIKLVFLNPKNNFKRYNEFTKEVIDPDGALSWCQLATDVDGKAIHRKNQTALTYYFTPRTLGNLVCSDRSKMIYASN